MKKQNIAIVGVIAFLLAVAVGYALFSETLNINGTATASGKFDYEFTEVGEITSDGYTKQTTDPVHELAVISDDKNTLTITVNKLDYPGAFVEIPVTITNVGSIKGKLSSITEENNIKETSKANELTSMIKVTYSGIAASDTVVAPGETNNMTIRIEWPEDYNFPEDSTSNAVEETISFSMKLNYEQVNE